MSNIQKVIEKTSTNAFPDIGTKLLSARWILSMSSPPIEDGGVIINANKIEAVLNQAQCKQLKELIEKNERQDIILHHYPHAVIMPGLINLHSHIDYAAMGQINPEGGTFKWIKRLVNIARTWSPADWQQSAHKGAEQAALSGISFLVDSSYSGQAAFALASIGLRSIVGLELFGLYEDQCEERWLQWLQKMASLQESKDSLFQSALKKNLITLTVSPHAPYTVCPSLWKRAQEWAQKKSLPILCHIAESSEEHKWICASSKIINDYLDFVFPSKSSSLPWQGAGLSPVGHLKKHGLLVKELLAAHCVHVDDEDIQDLKSHNVSIAVCARSNQYLKNGTPPIGALIAHNLSLGLGTDSLASCEDLNLLNEMRFAASLLDHTFTPEKALSLITKEAAAALGMAHLVGSLEPGKLADIAVFKFNKKDLDNAKSPYQLMFESNPQVLDLFVNGDLIVCNEALVS
jgi:5-methylthioadenosine/S-adenosylhomocysteine deaminase